MDEKVEQVPFIWMEESHGELCLPMTTKRKLRSKKIEFHGWGSKPLIEFLDSIGKVTGEKLSQYDVTTIITEYVKEKDLLHPEKKKRILCDERLQSLFGRKSVSRIKIYDLLEAHFAENHEESADEFEYCPEDKEQTAFEIHRRPKLSNSGQKAYQKRNFQHTLKSCFAAIIPENIKHVYLKRSLVLDLLKEPESFETKIVGSFVRVKSDPNDYFQKNSHQLLLVTGVKKAVDIGDSGIEILLQVSNLMSDIHICMLSDDNFTEEECEDLRQKVQEGLLKRLTVVELEEKARILHEDVTKHWIVRELALLQNLIDQANEKGWRKELFEYLEKRENLQTSSEQSRLLHEAPKVIPDDMELETTLQNHPDDIKEYVGLQNSLNWEASEISTSDLAVKEILSTRVSGQTDAADYSDSFLVMRETKVLESQIIELSSDENEDPTIRKNVDEDQSSGNQILDIDPGNMIWHYMDPQGDTQGPFSLACLKRWSDAYYFPPDFKVWKRGEIQDNAVLLSDLLFQIFPERS